MDNGNVKKKLRFETPEEKLIDAIYKIESLNVTLEYGISVQVVINVQVGYFLQNNKHTGGNKRTGGNLVKKNLTLQGQFNGKHLKNFSFLILI